MRAIEAILAIIVLLGWLCGMNAQSDNTTRLNQAVVGFQARGEAGLQTILRLGETAEVPVGVVRADDSLCRDKIDLSVQKDTVANIMSKVISQTPDYRWLTRDGVVIIEPKSISADTAEFLDIVIPRYAAPESTLQELAAFLLTDVRGVLRPNEGTAADILSSSNEARTKPFEMRDATVEQILNRMVKQGQGGAWILLPIPKDYRVAADRQFVQVVGYPDTEGRIGKISCQP
jgi:hypothetical protein